MEYYFDRDDRLERKKYAEFLETLLLNCDQYRREDSEGAYVIALDSPWGTGKTRFVKMLRNHLEKRKSEDGDNSITKKDAKFNVIYYNAWGTDFCVDALEPLIYTVINSPELNPSRFRKGVKQLLEEFGELASDVAKILAYSVAGRILGETAAGEIKDIVDRGDIDENDPLKDYKKRLDLYSDFKEALGKVIKATKKNLVIVVDELDRCRPTFAIQTLELAKHLFAVPGLIFIFSLDIKQLSYSVETVYGQKMDATGYLCRFFDYFMRMPNGDKRILINEFVECFDTNGYIKGLIPAKSSSKPRDELIDYIYDLVQKSSLSLRDITTIMGAFHLMIDAFLGKYNSLEIVKLYFCLLLVKFKYIDLFNYLFSGKRINEEFGGVVKKELGFVLNQDIQEKLRIIYDSGIISKRSLIVTTIDGVKAGGGSFVMRVENFSTDSIVIHWGAKPGDDISPQAVRYSSDFCVDELLYIPDMRRWDQIKHLTLAQYYHRQLEMFDFVLPADEAKA